MSSGSIVEGALVVWNGADTLGVVHQIVDGAIRVAWDEQGPPPMFSVADPPLERVSLTGAVERRSTGETAMLLEEVAAAKRPTWQCMVVTDQGVVTLNVPEADLRPRRSTDPLQRMLNGEVAPYKRYRLANVTRWYRNTNLNDDLVSLGDARVDIKPHQVGVVHRVVSNYPHRFLLCDEVGLGKTIEAGMILKELRARHVARRSLIIVPPNLLRQWQFEMKSKFNEEFAILNSATVAYLANQGKSGNPFAYFDSVLCSSGWVAGSKWAGLCAQVDWDLVVVDEAHHARRTEDRTTRLYRLARDLASPEHYSKRAMLFLTATPMQLSSDELYSLIEMLDPALFPTPQHFARYRAGVQGLNGLVEGLTRGGFPVPDEDEETTISKVAGWLNIDERLAAKRLRAGADEVVAVASDLRDQHLLSEVMIRNRKAVVGGFMPRHAHRWEVELTQAERDALAAVERYVQHGFNLAEQRRDNSYGFVMVIFQKLMASSIAAVTESLRKRRARLRLGTTGSKTKATATADELEARLDEDETVDEVLERAGAGDQSAALVRQEVELLDEVIDTLRAVEVDSKATSLLDQLRDLFTQRPDEKVIIFTEFRETQNHIAGLLEDHGMNVHLFHGQLHAEAKDASVEAFRSGAGPQVLICTEAGGEGRNFQFCHLLVNYDLPWNPMRVEQRIGRVDRIGQTEVVDIFNLWVKGTVEERVLDVLERRINVFEETVGGLDPILGDTERNISHILRLSEEKRAAALEQLGAQLEQQVRDARLADTQLRDLIMDTKSFSREIAERIAGQQSPVSFEDQDRFARALLADVRTHIKAIEGEYELTFHGAFRDTHHSDFFVEGPKKRAVFRPDQRPDSEHVEYMTFGHPIIDAIVQEVLSERYEGSTGAIQLLADDELAPTSGWLFVHQLTVPGVRVEEHLEPVFVRDGHGIDDTTGERILRRLRRFDKSDEPLVQEVLEAALPGLESAAELAQGHVEDLRERLEDEARAAADERVEKEIAKLQEWFTYRERAATDRVDTTKATLARLRGSDDPAQQRIVPVWESNLRRDEDLLKELVDERRRRLSEVERYRHPQVDWSLKSVGRIEIVAPTVPA